MDDVSSPPSPLHDTTSNSTTLLAGHEPLVRYGQKVMNIPGDKFGRKHPQAGNVSHEEDIRRYEEFPKFTSKEYMARDATFQDRFPAFLKDVRIHFWKDDLSEYSDVKLILDNNEEKVVEFVHLSMTVRLSQLKDVDCYNSDTYCNAQRAVVTELKSGQKMAEIEPPMGREVENYLIAEVIRRVQTPRTTKYRVSRRRPKEGTERQNWYKKIRAEVRRSFWLDHDRQARDDLRRESVICSPIIKMEMEAIDTEDRSQSPDAFFQHHHDVAAASGPNIYERVAKDILIIWDRNKKLVLCSVSQAFQRIYGRPTMEKVTDAIKKWSKIPSLPQRCTKHHVVDELIRRKHPEFDMERATTPEELSERAVCLVPYGTRATGGSTNPIDLYLTRHTHSMIEKSCENIDIDISFGKALAELKFGPFGLCAKLVKFIFHNLARHEYNQCCEAFDALPDDMRMETCKRSWASFIVLGINTFTERHRDRNDVKNGLSGLLPLGDYQGGDICFPQLGLKLDYKPGGCILFRGAELEHFVEDWTGYRFFVACTNHQSVRNWALRRPGRFPALPSNSNDWFLRPKTENDTASIVPPSTTDSDDENCFDPCVETEPEDTWSDSSSSIVFNLGL